MTGFPPLLTPGCFQLFGFLFSAYISASRLFFNFFQTLYTFFFKLSCLNEPGVSFQDSWLLHTTPPHPYFPFSFSDDWEVLQSGRATTLTSAFPLSREINGRVTECTISLCISWVAMREQALMAFLVGLPVWWQPLSLTLFLTGQITDSLRPWHPPTKWWWRFPGASRAWWSYRSRKEFFLWHRPKWGISTPHFSQRHCFPLEPRKVQVSRGHSMPCSRTTVSFWLKHKVPEHQLDTVVGLGRNQVHGGLEITARLAMPWISSLTWMAFLGCLTISMFSEWWHVAMVTAARIKVCLLTLRGCGELHISHGLRLACSLLVFLLWRQPALLRRQVSW